MAPPPPPPPPPPLASGVAAPGAAVDERPSNSPSGSEDERAATASTAAKVAALRAAPVGDNAGAGAGSGAVDTHGKKRKRRATYHVRKDEIEVLQQRMEDLEHELRALKYQALIRNDDNEHDDDDGSSQDTNSGGKPGRKRTLAKSSYTRHFLGDALQSQQFALAGLQAMVSSYASLQELSPVHTAIRLGRDPEQRQQALVRARERVLKDSKRFIAERSQGMDVFKVFSEQERYEVRDGNFCALGFDIVPLGATSKSVKRVFDTLFFQIRNIEITFSEMMGHIAIRENDDTGDAWLSQHRLVAAVAKNARIETNVVVFADFESGRDATEGSTTTTTTTATGEPDREEDERDFGIIVLEWIDDDELYPYRPKDRARRDTSCIFTVQVHSRKREQQAANGTTSRNVSSSSRLGETEGEDEEKCVVLKRWSQTKLRNVSPNLDMRAVQEMRASIGAWGDRMVQAMYESAHCSHAAGAAAPVSPPPGA